MAKLFINLHPIFFLEIFANSLFREVLEIHAIRNLYIRHFEIRTIVKYKCRNVLTPVYKAKSKVEAGEKFMNA